ncbi:MAG: hypothetical protein WDM79_14775 [Terricaulis sp.]
MAHRSQRNRARLTTQLVLAFLLAACAPEPRGPRAIGPDVEAVRARHVAYGEALAARDATATADFCATCQILDVEEDEAGPYVKVSLGNASLVADAGSAVTFGYADVQLSGDLAVSSSECSVTRTSPRTQRAILRRGYCTIVWQRREDEVWRIHSESRNVSDSLVQPGDEATSEHEQ